MITRNTKVIIGIVLTLLLATGIMTFKAVDSKYIAIDPPNERMAIDPPNEIQC
jgi:hypothetical protein